MLALLDHADHLGDDVAGALHQNPIAALHAQPLDLVFVVERRARNRDAADVHRLQPGPRRHRAGAADVYLDALDSVSSCRAGNL